MSIAEISKSLRLTTPGTAVPLLHIQERPLNQAVIRVRIQDSLRFRSLASTTCCFGQAQIPMDQRG